MTVTSKSNGANKFTISNAAGVVSRTCTTAGEGGCPAPGKW